MAANAVVALIPLGFASALYASQQRLYCARGKLIVLFVHNSAALNSSQAFLYVSIVQHMCP